MSPELEALCAMEYLFRRHVLSDLEMANLPDGTEARVRRRGGDGDWWTARIDDGVATDVSERLATDVFFGRDHPPISLGDLDVVAWPDTETLRVWLKPYQKMREAEIAEASALWWG